MLNLSFFRFCLTLDYQSAVIERSVIVMCDKKSDKTRKLSEHLFEINKHELSSFSGRSCAAKILGVWGFIIHVCLGFFSVCILALQGFENMSLYLPVFE